jgi:hypothetical protein
LRWAIPRKNGQQNKTIKRKKIGKKIGIKTKEVSFTPRVESLSYLLSTHLSDFLNFFLLGGCAAKRIKIGPTYSCLYVN